MMPIRRSAAVVLALLAAACAPAQPALAPTPAASSTAVRAQTPIAAALDSIFDDALFANAHWGVLVKSLRTGETVYARNAGRMFVPASNMKIVTAAAALEALGPEYRYRTRVAAAGPVSGGVLRGDLVVLGAGDPSISEHMMGDVRTVFRAWADSLRAHGVTRVTGSVLGNDDVFDDVPYGRGWAWDDMDAPYSAEVGGLMMNEGFVTVRAEPAGGQTARVTVRPAAQGWVDVAGTVAVGAADSPATFGVVRADGGALTVSGSIPADTAFVEEAIAIRNNTAFFAAALRQALVEAGIRVDGGAYDADQREGAAPTHTVLFTHTSPPMAEILAAFMKPSQNQIGEVLLKTLGAELRGTGSARAGVAVVDSLARAWGMPPRLLAQADGSGLSRYNLVAPAFLVTLLERESRSPHAQIFTASLPVAGRDGTLSSRMRGTPAEGNLRAKTGTLSGVRALSGYVTTAAGEPMVFSILMNHHTLSSRDVDRVAEAAIMRLIAHGAR
ncbi:MAG TPA: D-alanyl-D-alanine carboxypeptidase/D-alanyl-D-alanine-endopeptidase [Longimicrobium sp.]|jgi:D-alanyl-D-alanine carboxypeptidase/D-alanyl-D-alanine-endopeptidase (penicillin-binding protein 4)|uniref:D-alanyl-D-alanine carboxypeptidase/D-alanyl-D-alanine endopeptidase n=1 Tax=Longimicrobium sp. TaxID=2029185 RepID=UPI002ED9D6D4